MSWLDEILLKSAQEFEAGNAVPSKNFLHENNVSLDQAITLANNIATILRGFIRLDPEIRAMVLLLGADTEERLPVWALFDVMHQRRTLRRLTTGVDDEESLLPIIKGKKE